MVSKQHYSSFNHLGGCTTLLRFFARPASARVVRLLLLDLGRSHARSASHALEILIGKLLKFVVLLLLRHGVHPRALHGLLQIPLLELLEAGFTVVVVRAHGAFQSEPSDRLYATTVASDAHVLSELGHIVIVASKEDVAMGTRMKDGKRRGCDRLGCWRR